jgi:hypothetical protein
MIGARSIAAGIFGGVKGNVGFSQKLLPTVFAACCGRPGRRGNAEAGGDAHRP